MPIPRELSPGEEAFALHCKVHGLMPEREYIFCPPRKWRFDFAFPEKKLAVEIEGGTAFGKSRHSKGTGFQNDAIKYNAASRLQWIVLRYTTAMVMAGTAIDEVLEVLREPR